ncbi:hypothetical protein C5167_045968 [Papaver somniferum]|uniref:Uncharacterized protein n=1 Tax=Papaver somniferum TaxID=3469 RepID=A0A4Y7LEQ7_PAPSO|nr:hypothetical protein C5167_045968 [Papaver somniferum]
MCQVEFGYSRKDVLLIGVGVTLLGVGLKSGLEILIHGSYNRIVLWVFITCVILKILPILIAMWFVVQFAGVDPLQAGNVVQLVLVLGLTLGWISTYIFRVSNKEMTYVQQLRDYEDKVMEKRIEGLTEAELVVLLEQVEEEKQQRLAKGKKV